MKTNILVALKNVLSLSTNELISIYSNTSNNRANNMGDAFEFYIKDLFCNSIDINNFNHKDKKYSKYLSYLGNKNNPPDFIIKEGAAVEVKKVENLSFGDILLNSSYPKDYLYSNSPLISRSCKQCEENWIKKDMIYTIGNVVENKLRVLWLLYGDCYSAEEETYKKIKTKIKDGIEEISNVEFSPTKELGKVNKVDPLGITNLRIRGMWSIKHPMRVFNYLVEDYKQKTEFQVYCLILKNKYDELPSKDKENLEPYINNKILIKENVKIKNPNNPAKYLEAILFKASLLGQED